MTTRIDSPLTPTDRALGALLDQGYPRFTMISGAGSGKTTSLVKALAHIVEIRGDRLRSQGQQVACITYTEVAAREIYSDLAETPLAHVSTIHSFLWTVIKPFQNDIRAWVAGDTRRVIDAERAAAARGGAQRQRASDRAARYEAILAGLPTVTQFRYGTGRDYAQGLLGHHEILAMAPELIRAKPLLAKIVARRFPFILVDESQDTFEQVVAALMHIAGTQPGEFALGFFGDPMQKIYTTGVGAIDVSAGGNDWTPLAKPENFRSSLRVLELINAIRKSAGDPLEQESGLAAADQIQGEVTFVVLPTSKDRSATLSHTLQWLRGQSEIGAWDGKDGVTAAKILVIAHRMAARRLGFGGLYEAFHVSRTLRDAFNEGTAWPLTPFRETLLPLVDAAGAARHQLIPLLLKANPALRDRAGLASETRDLLAGLSRGVSSLAAVVHAGSPGSVGDALRIADSEGLVELDDRLRDALCEPAGAACHALDEDQQKALIEFLRCDAQEIRAYLTYLEDRSPYSTQQGIKGAEFPDVLVVLDDEEGNYSLFSYDKLLELKPLSRTDIEHAAAGDDTVLARTWRLLYVCASRARRALAIVLYATDVNAAVAALRNTGLPSTQSVWTLDKMTSSGPLSE
jgi:DNA helicase II / ATP-dependent DNA helicase PcrA